MNIYQIDIIYRLFCYMRDTSDLSTKKLIIKKYEVLPFLGMQFYIISHQFGIIFDLSSSKKDKTTLSTKVGNQMKAVNLSLPSTEFSESIRKYQNFFWRWYEKLSSICVKYFIPDWVVKDCQKSDKLPYY